jgi:hypothetical protein
MNAGRRYGENFALISSRPLCAHTNRAFERVRRSNRDSRHPARDVREEVTTEVTTDLRCNGRTSERRSPSPRIGWHSKIHSRPVPLSSLRFAAGRSGGWSERGDLNSRPPVPQKGAPSTNRFSLFYISSLCLTEAACAFRDANAVEIHLASKHYPSSSSIALRSGHMSITRSHAFVDQPREEPWIDGEIAR